MASEDGEPVTEFGARLWEAMAAEKKTPTRTEREAGLQRGYMSQVKAGKIIAPGPDVIRSLATYLGVGYEWLAIGRGPMRPENWAPTAFERASIFALEHGARRDAIDAAAQRYRDASAEMTGTDWILAFNAEAVRLERSGVPRPELVTAKQRKARRLSATKQRQDAELAALHARKTAAIERIAKKQSEVGDPTPPPVRKRRVAKKP